MAFCCNASSVAGGSPVFQSTTVTPPSSLLSGSFLSGSSKDDVLKQIPLQHDQTVKMLRDWIAIPSIAAENRGYPEGAEYIAVCLPAFSPDTVHRDDD